MYRGSGCLHALHPAASPPRTCLLSPPPLPLGFAAAAPLAALLGVSSAGCSPFRMPLMYSARLRYSLNCGRKQCITQQSHACWYQWQRPARQPARLPQRRGRQSRRRRQLTTPSRYKPSQMRTLLLIISRDLGFLSYFKAKHEVDSRSESCADCRQQLQLAWILMAALERSCTYALQVASMPSSHSPKHAAQLPAPAGTPIAAHLQMGAEVLQCLHVQTQCLRVQSAESVAG